MIHAAKFSVALKGFSLIAKPNIRCYGSITKINKKILLNFALARNPSALKVELLRVVNEASGTTDTGNFPKITAQVCVNKKNVELDLAFDILGCLEEVKSKSMMLGLFELVDECIDCGHIDEAMTAYSKLRNLKEKLDLPGKQRLLNALAYDCRIKDIMQILTDNTVTDGDLVIVAEPLIMTGNQKQFNGIFADYLLEKSVASPVQCSERVARVIRSVMYARMRRHMQLDAVTPEEKVAAKEMLKMLKHYHTCLDAETFMSTPSFFQTCQLLELTKERIIESELAAFEVGLSIEEHRAANRLPKFESTNFPYMVEGNHADHRDMRNNSKINDLSSELKKKYPSKILLYRDYAFPEAYGFEMKILKEKNMEIFFDKLEFLDSTQYSLIGAAQDDGHEMSDSDSDSDSDDGYDSMETTYDSEEFYDSDDESESDSEEDSEDEKKIADFHDKIYASFAELEEESFRRRTVRTLLPPSFRLNDITETLNRRKPSVTLEFSEDIFYQEPAVWPRIFMPGGFIFHKSEKKDHIPKN